MGLLTEEEPEAVSDYEPCRCGYDHSYEQEEAARWHSREADLLRTYLHFLHKDSERLLTTDTGRVSYE